MPAFNNQQILDRVIDRFSGTWEGDSVEIIIVDDCSYKPITCDKPYVRIIRHKKNLGVGAAFDTGVKAAETENIAIMGSDVFVPPHWYSKVMEVLADYPLSLTTSICTGFAGDQIPFREGRTFRYGADILRTHERVFGNRTQPDIIQAKWNLVRPDFGDNIVGEVNCILGAFYFTTKTVYNAIGGWMGHRIWGGLEPMISIRAKRMGYKIYVARDLETCHNFGRVPGTKERPARWDMYFYNKMLMAETMFEEPAEIKAFLYSRGTNNWLRVAEKLVASVAPDIREFHRQNWINGLIKNNEEL